MKILIQAAAGGVYFVLLMAGLNLWADVTDPVSGVARGVALAQLALLVVIAASVGYGTRELLRGLRDEED